VFAQPCWSAVRWLTSIYLGAKLRILTCRQPLGPSASGSAPSTSADAELVGMGELTSVPDGVSGKLQYAGLMPVPITLVAAFNLMNLCPGGVVLAAAGRVAIAVAASHPLIHGVPAQSRCAAWLNISAGTEALPAVPGHLSPTIDARMPV